MATYAELIRSMRDADIETTKRRVGSNIAKFHYTPVAMPRARSWYAALLAEQARRGRKERR